MSKVTCVECMRNSEQREDGWKAAPIKPLCADVRPVLASLRRVLVLGTVQSHMQTKWSSYLFSDRKI